jgi:glycosyltransferase involved in cell wall biosynthesis
VKRVLIIHPWLPQYRLPFFRKLQELLESTDIELTVAHGDPKPHWRKRGDAVTAPDMIHLPTHFLKVAGKPVEWRSLSAVRPLKQYDLIVAEHAIKNVESYGLLVAQAIGRSKLAWWGHGKTYTTKHSRLEAEFKNFVTNRGSWFFSYTDGGAAEVAHHGFPSDRITSLRNSTDVKGLTEALKEVQEVDIDGWRAKNDLSARWLVSYLGALDTYKNPASILRVGKELFRLRQDFQLVVAGGGEGADQLRTQGAHLPWLRLIGRVEGLDKALLLKSCGVLLIPGAIGLVAVDALTAGRPIVTSAQASHGPEYEYLTPGLSVFAENSEALIAERVDLLLSDPQLLQDLEPKIRESAGSLGIDSMAERFLDGLQHALEVRN